MSEEAGDGGGDQSTSPPSRLDRLVESYPELPYVAPFFSFLLLMSLGSAFEGQQHIPWLYAVRTFGALGVALLFWRYFPPLGKPHWGPAIFFGLLATVMWVGVHRFFAEQSWYPYTQVLGRDAKPEAFYNPFEALGSGVGLWLFLIVRIGGASTVVPIVEELFWRGFLLRLFINRWRWDKVPLGAYTLRSFILVSLLSAAEHPQWEVGILCWFLYNALFYWKKSLLFMMLTHGVTNFALYMWVVLTEDWVFWS